MFPESRFIIGVLGSAMGFFFVVCVQFVDAWEPGNRLDHVGKVVVMEVLFTFISLSGIALLACILGPDRVRSLINRVGGKAVVAGLAMMLGTFAYAVYAWLST